MQVPSTAAKREGGRTARERVRTCSACSGQRVVKTVARLRIHQCVRGFSREGPVASHSCLHRPACLLARSLVPSVSGLTISTCILFVPVEWPWFQPSSSTGALLFHCFSSTTWLVYSQTLGHSFVPGWQLSYIHNRTSPCKDIARPSSSSQFQSRSQSYLVIPCSALSITSQSFHQRTYQHRTSTHLHIQTKSFWLFPISHIQRPPDDTARRLACHSSRLTKRHLKLVSPKFQPASYRLISLDTLV